MTSSSYSMERLGDRFAIQDIIVRWCRTIDRLDLEKLEDLYHPDATEDHLMYKGDIKGYLAGLRGRQESIECMSHFVSNILIEFAGADVAVAETYCFAIMRFKEGVTLPPFVNVPVVRPDSKVDLLGHSRYVDRFERRNGEWRIANRVVVSEWVRFSEVPAGSPALNPAWTLGHRDRSDPLWAARAALGLSG
jgi:SnoaL-like domain